MNPISNKSLLFKIPQIDDFLRFWFADLTQPFRERGKIL